MRGSKIQLPYQCYSYSVYLLCYLTPIPCYHVLYIHKLNEKIFSVRLRNNFYSYYSVCVYGFVLSHFPCMSEFLNRETISFSLCTHVELNATFYYNSAVFFLPLRQFTSFGYEQKKKQTKQKTGISNANKFSILNKIIERTTYYLTFILCTLHIALKLVEKLCPLFNGEPKQNSSNGKVKRT